MFHNENELFPCTFSFKGLFLAKTAKINATVHLYAIKTNITFTQVSIVIFLVVRIVKRLFFSCAWNLYAKKVNERGDAEGIRGRRI